MEACLAVLSPLHAAVVGGHADIVSKMTQNGEVDLGSGLLDMKP